MKRQEVLKKYKRPETCISIKAETQEEIYKQAALINSVESECSRADMIEWRADFFEYLNDVEKVCETAMKIKAIIGEKPLIFTVRTEDKERTNLSHKKSSCSGAKISQTEYFFLCYEIVRHKAADYVDVELSAGMETAYDIIAAAERNGVTVIISYHNFEMTPCETELEKTVSDMKKMLGEGHGFIKVCAKAADYDDVRRLMNLALKNRDKGLFISMGSNGLLSRLAGGFLGSPIIFCSSRELSSAENKRGELILGQVGIKETSCFLNKIDESTR